MQATSSQVILPSSSAGSQPVIDTFEAPQAFRDMVLPIIQPSSQDAPRAQTLEGRRRRGKRRLSR